MRNRKVIRMSWLAKTVLCLALFVSAAVTAGCNPASYLSKNMCNIFDCDTLFFIEDIFPLSQRPTAGGGEEEMAEMDSGGGH